MERLLRVKLRELARQEDLREHCSVDSLAAFRENRLTSKERERVASHLSLCQTCREVLALASDSPEPTPSTGHRLFTFQTARLGAVAALLLICLCTAALYLHSGGKSTEKPSKHTNVARSENLANSPTRIGPRLAEAVVQGSPIGSAETSWKVNTAQHPASLEISRDHGGTWKQVSVPDFQPKAVVWKNAMVWVIDEHGVVMQSDDNGGHWIRLQQRVRSSPTR